MSTIVHGYMKLVVVARAVVVVVVVVVVVMDEAHVEQHWDR